MFTIYNIINEHFLSEEKKQILFLFKKHDVFEIVTKSVIQLEKQLSESKDLSIPAVASSSSNFLVAVNTKIYKIKNQTERRQIQESVAEIGVRILLSIVKKYPDHAADLFKEIKGALMNTAELFGFNFNDIADLMKIEYLEELATITGKQQAEEIKKIPESTIPAIIWAEVVAIDYLLSELKSRKWILSIKEFSKLFNNNDTRLRSVW